MQRYHPRAISASSILFEEAKVPYYQQQPFSMAKAYYMNTRFCKGYNGQEKREVADEATPQT